MLPPRIPLLLAFLAYVAPLAGAQSSPPTTGTTATYEIEMDAGLNVIALPVVPAASAVTDIVAGVLPQLTFVQDESGRYFVPAQGIDDLGTWAWDEAYKLELTAPATLTVMGSEIVPQFSPMALESGIANWVPYARSEPMAVAEAFASISSTLVKVEAADRRFYAPGDGASTLDSLRVGQGYKVWVTQSTALTYPANSGQQSDGSTVNTLAEALTLNGLAAGQAFEVRGYYAPGDGGGGLFRVVDASSPSALPCDGGLVFCPEEALGAVVSETVSRNSSTTSYLSYNAGRPIAFGTFAYTIAKDDRSGTPWSLVLTDLDMHGATSTAHMSDDAPFFDHATGTMYLSDFTPTRLLNAHTGSTGYNATVSYRPIANGLRLVRDTTAVAGVWEARWFGCRADDDVPAASYFNNANCLNWAGQAIRARNAEAPGSVTALRLSDNDDDGQRETFYYIGAIALAENTELWGERGAEVVDSTDAYGNAFSFVRARPDATVLKVLPENAPAGAPPCGSCRPVLAPVGAERIGFGQPGHLAPTPDVFLGAGLTSVTFWEGSTASGLRRLVLDGSYPDHLSIYEEPYTFDQREEYLRNSPGYSGFNAGNHNGKDVAGHVTTLEDVVISGYAASGLLVDQSCAPTVVRRVAIGDAGWNHAIYSQGTTVGEDFTLFGFTWSHVMRAGTLNRFTIMNGRLTPHRWGGHGGVQWRGYNISTCEGTESNCGLDVDGYYFHFLEGSSLWSGIGPEWHLRNGIGVWAESYGSPVYGESHNGFAFGRYEDVAVDGLRLHYTEGPIVGNSAILHSHGLHESYFRGIEVSGDPNGPVSGNAGLDFNSALYLSALPEEGGPGDVFEIVFDRIGVENPLGVRWIYAGDAYPEDYTIRYFFRDAHFSQSDDFHHQIAQNDFDLRGPGGGYEFYWRDVSFDLGGRFGTQYRKSYYEKFLDAHRFENVTDNVTGNTSEATGTYTCGPSDGTTPRLQLTGLMMIPHPTRGEVAITGGTFAGSAVSWAEAESDGTAYDDDDDPREPYVRLTLTTGCAAGQTIEWSAAVSKWEDANGAPVAFPSTANGGWYAFD